MDLGNLASILLYLIIIVAFVVILYKILMLLPIDGTLKTLIGLAVSIVVFIWIINMFGLNAPNFHLR